ncbi:hypothetical protein EDD16DRAFT_426208 [Pisolithus croceorrhizus]|nr:hypothetical protein EDD16DRAFT_426208 [Pisolithus croceorrhizus]
MGLHERREERRELFDERREALRERREEGHHHFGEHRGGGDHQHGRGGLAERGLGALHPSSGFGASQPAGRGYNPGYVTQDANLYNDNYESSNHHNVSHPTEVRGYGTGGAYARPHDSTDEAYSSAYAPSRPVGAPDFGTGPPAQGPFGPDSAGRRREGLAPGVGYPGRDSSYDTPQSYGGRDEYSARSSGYSAPESYRVPHRNDEDRDDYPGSRKSGYGDDRDQYSGARSSGYGPPESEYGTNVPATGPPPPYGGPRRGDGDEYFRSTTQHSGVPSGPAGGFVARPGDGASTHDDEPGPTMGSYGRQDSRPEHYGPERRGYYDGPEPGYGSKTSSSGYDAPHSSYAGKPPGYDDGRRRDEDTYSGGPAHGRLQRDDYDDDDDERNKRHQQHLDAHAQVYGSDADSHASATPDVLGAAAAMEALRLTAADKQSQASGRPGGRRPDVGDDDAGHSNAPAGGLRPSSDHDDVDASPAPTSKGSSMQDKIVALAMSQAGKMFDKKHGGSGGSGDSSGKSEGTHLFTAFCQFCAGTSDKGWLLSSSSDENCRRYCDETVQ